MQRLCMIANQLNSCPVTGATCTQSGCTGTTKPTLPPIKVTVTGGAGAIGYALVFMIGQGKMFGPNRPVDLTILELPFAESAMKGVIMELEDCALPLLNSLRGTINSNEGFKGCEVAILVGAKPRGPGMERKDLLEQNAKIFQEQGKAINDNADRNCKVLVVGNPANTNAMTVSLFAPNIPKKNITALTRLDQNRAVTQIATKVGVPVAAVKNIIIWGNHSTTQYPDPFQGYIINYPTQGIATSIRAAVNDDKWLTTLWIPRVQKRGAEIIAARKLSSAASAANAVCDHINSWINGTQPGEVVSMGVISDGSYGVPKGLNFSFPCVCIGGDLKIVENFKFDDFGKKMIEVTTKELSEERDMVNAFINKK